MPSTTPEKSLLAALGSSKLNVPVARNVVADSASTSAKTALKFHGPGSGLIVPDVAVAVPSAVSEQPVNGSVHVGSVGAAVPCDSNPNIREARAGVHASRPTASRHAIDRFSMSPPSLALLCGSGWPCKIHADSGKAPTFNGLSR
jgi:hypothetical protein